MFHFARKPLVLRAKMKDGNNDTTHKQKKEKNIMITIFTVDASIFASVACFVGDTGNAIDNVHIMIHDNKAFVEAVNGYAFCQHALDSVYSEDEAHYLIMPTKELIKACKAKNADMLEVLEDMSVRVIDTHGNTTYIHPTKATTCEAGHYPDTSMFITKVDNPRPDFTGVMQISLPCSSFELFKSAFGKDSVYKFSFIGETEPIKVTVQDTEFIVIVMPMLNR